MEVRLDTQKIAAMQEKLLSGEFSDVELSETSERVSQIYQRALHPNRADAKRVHALSVNVLKQCVALVIKCMKRDISLLGALALASSN